MSTRILVGDALSMLWTLESESVQVCVTSPPYFGLRAYGTDPQVWGGDLDHVHDWDTVPSPGARSSDTKPGPLQHPGNMGRERLTSDLCPCGAWRGELGLEPTPALFIEHLVAIFDEVRRVLRPDGLCFVNLGDSYSNDAKWGGSSGGKHVSALHGQTGIGRQKRTTGVAAKSLFLIPERFAIAMQEAGWIVRSRIAWCKKSAMPESVRDRPTSAWEHVWMFAKSRSYFWDADAVRQPSAEILRPQSEKRREMRMNRGVIALGGVGQSSKGVDGGAGITHVMRSDPNGANLRNFWLLGPEPNRLEHYAAFPSEIPHRCILAGSRPGDVVLDPFLGSGTVAVAAKHLGRECVGIELNAEYAEQAERRIETDVPKWARPAKPARPRRKPAAPIQRDLFDQAQEVAG